MMELLILAQLGNPDPHEVGKWLQVALPLGLVVVAALTLWIRVRQPQKREVTLSEHYVTEEHCEHMQAPLVQRVVKVEREIIDLRAELKRDREALEHSNEARAIDIHRRIDALQREVNQIPNLVVSQLLNTKQLWRSENTL